MDVSIVDMARAPWKAFTRRARAIGRRLTPPGNRASIAESGNYRPGSSSGGAPSPAELHRPPTNGGLGGL
jgi:hypothetical protein